MGTDGKEALAHARTDLAEDRTVLANERTYAGWMRTGFAAVGVALGFHALFQKMEPTWIPRSIATAFLVIGALIFLGAERRAASVIRRLSTHEVETVRLRNLRFLTVSILLTIGALIAALWMLKLRPE
jgi:putative membrane protein